MPEKDSSSIFYKKAIKDYFTEFVMLFAAVTLGFFAENLREEYAERKLERQLMKSMVADSFDPVELQKYYNNFYYLRRNTETQLRNVADLIESTTELKKLIIKEYKF